MTSAPNRASATIRVSHLRGPLNVGIRDPESVALASRGKGGLPADLPRQTHASGRRR